jgi:hypothetical protein
MNSEPKQSHMTMVYPHPGCLPTKSTPKAGESLVLRLQGLPSFKEISRSIRNKSHRNYAAFARLREAAIEAMDGRECYSGGIRIELRLHAPELERRLSDYAAGIEDSLDGSHGPTFTYLPIVYQDDCQVCEWSMLYIRTTETFYTLHITFL